VDDDRVGRLTLHQPAPAATADAAVTDVAAVLSKAEGESRVRWLCAWTRTHRQQAEALCQMLCCRTRWHPEQQQERRAASIPVAHLCAANPQWRELLEPEDVDLQGMRHQQPMHEAAARSAHLHLDSLLSCGQHAHATYCLLCWACSSHWGSSLTLMFVESQS
jgi:hypothetical protein